MKELHRKKRAHVNKSENDFGSLGRSEALYFPVYRSQKRFLSYQYESNLWETYKEELLSGTILDGIAQRQA